MAKSRRKPNESNGRLGLGLVERALELATDGRDRAVAFGESRMAGIGEVIDRAQVAVEERVDAIEVRTSREARRWMRRIEKSPIAKSVGRVPKRVRGGIDRLLDRVGLMRAERHRELLAKARKRAESTRRPAKRAQPAMSAA